MTSFMIIVTPLLSLAWPTQLEKDQLALYFDQLRDALAACKGELIVETHSLDDKTSVRSRSQFTLRTGACGDCIIRHYREEELAYIKNSRYAALVARDVPHAWKLVRVAPSQSQEFSSLDTEVRLHRQLVINYFSGYGLRGSVTLLDVFRGGPFTVTAVRNTKLDGKNVTAVEYAFTQPVDPAIDYVPYRKGVFFVTTDIPFDLLGKDLTAIYTDGTGGGSSRVVSTLKLPNGARVPERTLASSYAKAANGEVLWRQSGETTVSFQPLEFAEHAFTLSAFGLPEPHGVTWPKPTPYWLYGTLLAVLAIFIGIVLVRWSLKPKAG